MTVPYKVGSQTFIKADGIVYEVPVTQKYDLTKTHPQYFTDKNNDLNVSPSDYGYPYEKPVHEMPTIETGYDWVKDVYHRSESNIRPVEATPIELGHKIEQLENDLAFEKTSVLYAQQASQRLIDENRDWEVKFRNLEFANRNLQSQVDKIPALKRTIKYMMVEHLDIELGDE